MSYFSNNLTEYIGVLFCRRQFHQNPQKPASFNCLDIALPKGDDWHSGGQRGNVNKNLLLIPFGNDLCVESKFVAEGEWKKTRYRKNQERGSAMACG